LSYVSTFFNNVPIFCYCAYWFWIEGNSRFWEIIPSLYNLILNKLNMHWVVIFNFYSSLSMHWANLSQNLYSYSMFNFLTSNLR
jgi:hypothetical protein